MAFVAPPAAPKGPAGFTITLDFSGGGLTASQQAIFSEAKAAWEARISGYQPGIAQNGVLIQARGAVIDGAGGILGSAGPTSVASPQGAGNWVVAIAGAMTFDSADLAALEAGGRLDEVIEHEMGHVLGVGTLWGFNGDYTNNTFQYTGANGLGAWRADFSGQGAATFVPVEDDGGPGTANGHWNEVAGGAGPVGITDPSGNDMRDELMTGWLNAEIFYSRLTHEHLIDLGFTVHPFGVGQIFSDGFESGNTSRWSSQ